MLEKLRKYSINEIFKNTFILLFTVIPIGILYFVIAFSRTDYHSALVKSYIIINFLDNLIFFLPAFFIAALVYTVNTSFGTDEIKKYKTGNIIFFFMEFSFAYIIIIIILAGLLNSTIINKQDGLRLEDKRLKLQDRNKEAVFKLIKEADAFIEDEKYYDALERLQEILIIIPDYEPAKDRIEAILDKQNKQRIKELKRLRKIGIKFFNDKKYRAAVIKFKTYLKMKPDDKDIIKYLNLSKQEIDIEQRRLVKDKYHYKIHLDKNLAALIEHKRKINKIINSGKIHFKEKQYNRAKKEFKKILKFDINNFEALYYIRKANEKISRIRYFTNRTDKLIKNNLSYFHDKYKIFITQLRKAGDEDYIFYRTTFTDRKSGRARTYKYGYLDRKERKYKFLNDFKKDKSPLVIDNINPQMIWHFKQMSENPEKFPFHMFLSFRKYCIKYLKKDHRLFTCILMIKINYYILVIFLFINFILLFFYMRKMGSRKKIKVYNFIFLPALAILIYIIFFNLFQILKKILFLGQYFYSYSIIINITYYVLLYILFFILFRILYFKEERVKVVTKKSKRKREVKQAQEAGLSLWREGLR